MKIQIEIDTQVEDTQILVVCNHLDPNIEKIIAMLRVMELKLTGIKDNQTYILDASKIYYIDTVDKKTFFYTENEVYETQLKLYELEEQLSSCDFFRAGKSCIINFSHIKSLCPDIDGRILVTMNNQEKLMVSRQYVSAIKNKLGVK